MDKPGMVKKFDDGERKVLDGNGKFLYAYWEIGVHNTMSRKEKEAILAEYEKAKTKIVAEKNFRRGELFYESGN